MQSLELDHVSLIDGVKKIWTEEDRRLLELRLHATMGGLFHSEHWNKLNQPRGVPEC
jgi:hypothetical protein